MTRDNDNEAITRLPILVPTQKASGDGWIMRPNFGPAMGYGPEWRMVKRQPVRVVPADVLKQFLGTRGKLALRTKLEAEFGHIPERAAEQLTAILSIAGAASEQNLQRVTELAKKAAKSWPELTEAPPWDNVGVTFNTALFKVALVIWQKETQLAPALLCQSLSEALFAHALFAVTGKFGLGFCRRCGNPLLAVRTDQAFCNSKCRVAVNMKRYRANKKKEEESQGRRRGRRARMRIPAH